MYYLCRGIDAAGGGCAERCVSSSPSTIALWCNGSTTVFGSVCLGSNPGKATQSQSRPARQLSAREPSRRSAFVASGVSAATHKQIHRGVGEAHRRGGHEGARGAYAAKAGAVDAAATGMVEQMAGGGKGEHPALPLLYDGGGHRVQAASAIPSASSSRVRARRSSADR